MDEKGAASRTLYRVPHLPYLSKQRFINKKKVCCNSFCIQAEKQNHIISTHPVARMWECDWECKVILSFLIMSPNHQRTETSLKLRRVASGETQTFFYKSEKNYLFLTYYLQMCLYADNYELWNSFGGFWVELATYSKKATYFLK